MNNNNTTPWWAQNLPESETLKEHQKGSVFKPIPSLATLTWITILIIGTVSVGWWLSVIHPPVGRNIEFGGFEYYTDVSTINSQCTNIFVFGDADPYGIISLDNAKNPITVARYDEYIINAREKAARGNSTINPEQEAIAFYTKYPIPRSVVSIPISGYMFAEGLDPDNKFISPGTFIPAETVLRSMFDGAIIFWYDPTNPTLLDNAKAYAEDNSIDNLYVIPWYYPFSMPDGKSMAISSWNTSINCGGWSETAMNEFVSFVNQHPEIKPKTALPPTAPINEVKGTLFSVDLLPVELKK